MRIRFSLSRLSVLAFALPMVAFLSAGPFCESRAHGQGLGATPTKAFRVPAGFEVEMVHEVSLAEQGSWVAMCVDMKGRLIVSDQYGKLYRVTPAPSGEDVSKTVVEPLAVEIGMAQGLLHTQDGLYVDVNGKGPTGAG